jgi:hypothetical protein
VLEKKRRAEKFNKENIDVGERGQTSKALDAKQLQNQQEPACISPKLRALDHAVKELGVETRAVIKRANERINGEWSCL